MPFIFIFFVYIFFFLLQKYFIYPLEKTTTTPRPSFRFTCPEQETIGQIPCCTRRRPRRPSSRASRGRLPELGVLSPASQYRTERAEGSSVRAEGYCVRAGGVLRAHLRNISQIPAEGTRGRNGQLARHTSSSTGGAPRFIGRSVRGPTRGPPRGIRPAVSPLAPEGSKKMSRISRGAPY
mgnify:CR=1 FL=1